MTDDRATGLVLQGRALSGRGRPTRLAFAVLAAGLLIHPTPASACSPVPPARLREYLAVDEIAIRATWSIETLERLDELFVVVQIRLRPTHFMKWPVELAPDHDIVAQFTAVSDDVNCPPWYEYADPVFFTLKRLENGGYQLTGAHEDF